MMVVLAILLTVFGSTNGSLSNGAPPVAYDGMSGFPGVASTAAAATAATAPPPASGPSDDGMSGFPGH